MCGRHVLSIIAASSATVSAQMDHLPVNKSSSELNSMFVRALALNRECMMSLDTEQLLHTFRLNAGIPTCAALIHCWENTSYNVWGQSMGQFLSALPCWASTQIRRIHAYCIYFIWCMLRQHGSKEVAQLHRSQRSHAGICTRSWTMLLFTTST